MLKQYIFNIFCARSSSSYRPSKNKNKMQLLAYQNIDKNTPAKESYYKNFGLISKLTTVALGLSGKNTKGLLPNEFSQFIEILVRQKLIETSLFPSLMPQLMLNVLLPRKSVVVALPNVWLNELKTKGLKVSRLSSLYLMLLEQIFGVTKGFRCFLSLLVKTTPIKKSFEQTYMVFNNLPNHAFPTSLSAVDEHQGFVNWYLQHNFTNESGKFLWIVNTESEKIDLGPNSNITSKPFPMLNNTLAKLNFVGRTIIIIFTTLFRFLFGAWWIPLILDELITFAYFQALGRSKYAAQYVFNNSEFHFRPLWTYLAEKSGSRIIMAYYSSNVVPFEYINYGMLPPHPGYH